VEAHGVTRQRKTINYRLKRRSEAGRRGNGGQRGGGRAGGQTGVGGGGSGGDGGDERRTPRLRRGTDPREAPPPPPPGPEGIDAGREEAPSSGSDGIRGKGSAEGGATFAPHAHKKSRRGIKRWKKRSPARAVNME